MALKGEPSELLARSAAPIGVPRMGQCAARAPKEELARAATNRARAAAPVCLDRNFSQAVAAGVVASALAREPARRSSDLRTAAGLPAGGMAKLSWPLDSAARRHRVVPAARPNLRREIVWTVARPPATAASFVLRLRLATDRPASESFRGANPHSYKRDGRSLVASERELAVRHPRRPANLVGNPKTVREVAAR